MENNISSETIDTEQKQKCENSATCYPKIVYGMDKNIGYESSEAPTNLHVGVLWRKHVIYIKDSSLAQFHAKLRYDNFRDTKFFQAIIEAYLQDHPVMRQLMLELDPRMSKRKLRIKKKEAVQTEQIVNDFALNEEEIQNIFDDILTENGDL